MTALFGTPAMLLLDGLMIAWTYRVLSLNAATRPARTIAAASLAAWLGALYIVFGLVQPLPTGLTGGAFYALVLAGVAAVGALLLGVGAIRRYILAMDQQQLMLFQGIRVYFGACFLIQGGLGLLPATFGVVDGLSHVTAGFLGLTAAAAAGARGSAWLANLFGLADILVVATTLAFVLLPQIGPHHPMMYAVFLPAPLWLWAHVVSIKKLVDARAELREAIA